jgi:hypothetical protein
MMISDKQHEANLRNAQKSTGPKTPEGKEAVRFNALQHGLRARSVVLSCEKQEHFDQLCADLEAEWQPQTFTERLLVEQMAVNQWVLSRLAVSESLGYLHTIVGAKEQYALLDRIVGLRARYERSFSKAMHDLQQLQRSRRPAPKAVAEPAPAPAREPVKPAASHPEPPPPYLMSAGAASSRILTDTR